MLAGIYLQRSPAQNILRGKGFMNIGKSKQHDQTHEAGANRKPAPALISWENSRYFFAGEAVAAGLAAVAGAGVGVELLAAFEGS